MTSALDSVSPRTQRVIECLVFNKPLAVPALVDYAVDSQQHYRALREAISYYDQPGDTEEKIEAILRERWQEFERIRCDGTAITAFVEKYAPQFIGLTFKTTWDEIHEGFKEAGSC